MPVSHCVSKSCGLHAMAVGTGRTAPVLTHKVANPWHCQALRPMPAWGLLGLGASEALPPEAGAAGQQEGADPLAQQEVAGSTAAWPSL